MVNPVDNSAVLAGSDVLTADRDATLLESLVLAPSFGLPKGLDGVSSADVERLIRDAVALAERKAKHSSSVLVTAKKEAVLRMLEQRETMGRTVHYALAKRCDAEALLDRVAEKGGVPDTHAIEFLERQRDMGSLLTDLFTIDLLSRAAKLHGDGGIAVHAEQELSAILPELIGSVRGFIEGNSAAVSGSLHVKSVADELLTLLSERAVAELLPVLSDAVCARYADLIAADFQPFNSWRIPKAL